MSRPRSIPSRVNTKPSPEAERQHALARLNGQVAAADGRPRAANPFLDGSAMADAWNQGYDSAFAPAPATPPDPSLEVRSPDTSPEATTSPAKATHAPAPSDLPPPPPPRPMRAPPAPPPAPEGPVQPALDATPERTPTTTPTSPLPTTPIPAVSPSDPSLAPSPRCRFCRTTGGATCPASCVDRKRRQREALEAAKKARDEERDRTICQRIADALQRALALRGLSVEELAALADVPRDTTLALVSYGIGTLRFLDALAEVLEVDRDALGSGELIPRETLTGVAPSDFAAKAARLRLPPTTPSFEERAAGVREKIAALRAAAPAPIVPRPRYDETFAEGTAWLDGAPAPQADDVAPVATPSQEATGSTEVDDPARAPTEPPPATVTPLLRPVPSSTGAHLAIVDLARELLQRAEAGLVDSVVFVLHTTPASGAVTWEVGFAGAADLVERVGGVELAKHDMLRRALAGGG